MPLEYVHEPCKAPLSVQQEAGCVVGTHYPEPCLDHEQAYAANVDKLRRFFNIENRKIFESFLNDKSVLKPANSKEFHTFVYANFLDQEFDDF